MMFRITHLRRALLVGNSLSCRCSSRISVNTLDSLRVQRIRLVPSCRLACSTPNLQNFELIYTKNESDVITVDARLLKITGLAISLQGVHEVLTKVHLTLQDKAGDLTALDTRFLLIIIGMALLNLMMPFFLHFVTKRKVIKMYYNAVTDKYLMETYNLFLTTKYTTFRPDECRAPKFEVLASAIIQEKFPVIFIPTYFTDIQHYKRLLKYIQPIDFADDEEGSEKTTFQSEMEDLKVRVGETEVNVSTVLTLMVSYQLLLNYLVLVK